MSLSSKYKKSLEHQWCMRFKTLHPDRDNYDGVITNIKKRFIVLHEEKDFEFDGIVIMPKRVITGFRDSKYERCGNEIIRENGAIKKIRSLSWLERCEKLPDILKEIMKRNIWPGIETVFNKNKKSAFYIGPITDVADDHFFLRCYDATGKWEKEYKLTFDEIFKIEIGGKYCTHFNAYMRQRDST